MDRRIVLIAASFLAIPCSPVAAEDDPAAWIYFDSREAAKGPVLAVESASGAKSEIPASADTVVISYLNTFLGGGHAQLSVDLGDRNRVLLRFEVPAGPKLRKAELVLQVGLPPKPPKDPFPVALFPVEGDWEEASASWGRQPAYGRKSVQKAVVPIKVAPCRINVTEAVNGWIAHPETNRGWLLRVNKPLPDKDVAGSTPPPPPPGPTEGPLPDVRALYRWAPNARDAVKRAEAEGRMVLALVDGSADPAAPSFGASLVLSILLADPDVRALVEARFVPVQVGYQPGFYTAKGSVPNDPLQPLGSPAASVKGPALLVADAKGKTSAVLEGIGTWDREAVLRFLSEALPPLRGEKDPWKLLAGGSLREAAAILAKDGGPRAAVGLARIEALGGNHAKAVDLLFPLCGKGGAAAAEARTYRGVCLLRLGRTAEAAADLGAAADLEGPERARALYFLGCALWHDGKTAEARRAWERIGAECAASPWTLPAKNRLAAPERFAAFENLSAAPFAAGSRTTEVPAARANLGAVVARAADYLLDQQAPDGSWPVGESGQALCIPGITALCARALLEWQDGIGKERGERAGKAVAKAVAWLRERWTAEPPSSANSFCAAYVLAFHLARMAKDPEAKKDAVAVLPQLLGGQCDNGAWSYDRRFGESWKGGFGGWPKTDRGRVHSMNTGLALCVLAAARDAGLEVDAKAQTKGAAALKRMKTGPAAFTYTWPDPISFEKADLSLGRAILCELALARLGQGSDVNVAIENFMEHRAWLRGPVKLTPGWTMPGGVSSYFYFFAYFHAVEAMAGNPSRQPYIDQLCDDLLAVVEADGTWVDYPAIGKPYATAMALLVLRKATAK